MQPFRSGVAYRPTVPDTEKLRTDLETLAAGATMRLQQPWSTVMPSIIDAAERDKDLAQLQSQIHAKMRGAFITAIERTQARGELPRSQDARELVASILGPFCTGASSLVSRLTKLSQKGGRARLPQCPLICG